MNAAQQNILNTPTSYFPYSATVPFSPETAAALTAQTQRALQGSPLTGAAQDATGDVIAGQYLLSNPALSPLGDFSSGARTGSNPAYGLLAPVASGGALALNPVYQAAGGVAGGGALADNPVYGLVGPEAAGATVGTNIANPMIGGLGQGQGLAQNPTYGAVMPAAYGADIGTNIGYGLLGDTATGQYLNSNPYLDDQYDAMVRSMTRNYTNAVAPGIDSRAAGVGRMGSNSWQGLQGQAQSELGTALGDAGVNLYGQNYAQERQNQLNASQSLSGIQSSELARQLQAAQTLGGIYQGDIGQQLGAASTLGQFYQGDLARQLGAQQSLGSAYQNELAQQLQAAGMLGQAYQGDIGQQLQAAGATADMYNQDLQRELAAAQGVGSIYGQERALQAGAAGLAPQLAAQDYYDISQLGAVGSAQQQQAQAQLSDLVARYQYGQMEPSQRTNAYLAAIQGFGGLGGTQTSSQPLYSNPLSSILGAASTGAGIYSLLAGSDRRLKKFIRRVATLTSGLGLYVYKYIWSSDWSVGVMADEVERVMPGAVGIHSSGYKYVDYGLLFTAGLLRTHDKGGL
jgi:hypothetical protein